MMQKLCTHICKCKNDNYPRNGARGDKESCGGSEFNYDMFNTLQEHL
jgi:hypothetical protein